MRATRATSEHPTSMTVVFLLLLHFMRLVGGFVVACLASAVVVVGATGPLGGALAEGWTMAAAIASVAVLSVVIGGFAAMPALVAVAVAETFGVTALAYFIVCGGLIGALPGLAGSLDGIGWHLDAASGATALGAAARPGIVVGLAAGFVGGIAFWLVVGRTCGIWRVWLAGGGDGG